MKIKKIILTLSSFFLLNGCIESTALLGPAITGMSTGSIYEASLSYGASHVIKKETGQSTVEHMTEILEPINKKKEKKLKAEFIELVENRVKLTREKLFLNDN